MIYERVITYIQFFISDIAANFGFNHTQSGWMKGDAFYYFVTEHLHPRWLQMGIEFPVVLVIDGYSAHKSTELFLWCKRNDVILLLLYPNSTHILQVLDIAIFAPLKVKYSDLFEDWKDLHPIENFTELEFIKVLKATNDAVMKPDTIINGWRASGLQPFNVSNVNLRKLVTNSTISTIQIDQTQPIMETPFNSNDVNNEENDVSSLCEIDHDEYEYENVIESENELMQIDEASGKFY